MRKLVHPAFVKGCLWGLSLSMISCCLIGSCVTVKLDRSSRTRRERLDDKAVKAIEERGNRIVEQAKGVIVEPGKDVRVPTDRNGKPLFRPGKGDQPADGVTELGREMNK